ncbi:hypothetical protein VMCG_04889 [Cytospora schulzeri]|uniref:AB hydrolase-1 domain-containing protein n=1 Tax=Cytospora schulzeri TaxID=448051 RepID=A0A423WND6_9PEZI|nr:hypothetical protein VMCG_04889 [Valsa malicola]
MASRRPSQLVIPRPGTTTNEDALPSPIRAPPEADMTKELGCLLPKASYLSTKHGQAAYYVYPPTEPLPADQPPLRVLMVHGVQTSALGLQPLATALRARFPAAHIALVDLWGHGLSDTPLAPHVASLFHGLLDAVLTALAWQQEPIRLVGFSFGGSLAAGYAALHPERVDSVALIAPAGLMSFSIFPEAVQNRYGLTGAADDVDEEGTLDFVIEFLEGGKLSVPVDWRDRVDRGEVVAEAVRDWEMREHPGHAGSVVAIFRDGGVFDNHAAFRALVQTLGADKCLGVLGELDEVCSKQYLLDVGFSNIIVILQVGHAVVRERAAQVATSIENFWRALY